MSKWLILALCFLMTMISTAYGIEKYHSLEELIKGADTIIIGIVKSVKHSFSSEELRNKFPEPNVYKGDILTAGIEIQEVVKGNSLKPGIIIEVRTSIGEDRPIFGIDGKKEILFLKMSARAPIFQKSLYTVVFNSHQGQKPYSEELVKEIKGYLESDIQGLAKEVINPKKIVIEILEENTDTFQGLLFHKGMDARSKFVFDEQKNTLFIDPVFSESFSPELFDSAGEINEKLACVVTHKIEYLGRGRAWPKSFVYGVSILPMTIPLTNPPKPCWEGFENIRLVSDLKIISASPNCVVKLVYGRKKITLEPKSFWESPLSSRTIKNEHCYSDGLTNFHPDIVGKRDITFSTKIKIINHGIAEIAKATAPLVRRSVTQNNRLAGQSTFNLLFKYGYNIEAPNILNTFEGAYTKDMILDRPITTKLLLSNEELNRIHQKMMEINFFDYPDKFSVSVSPDEPVQTVHPHFSYYFKVAYNSKIKELSWEDGIFNKDEKAEKLRELIELIRNIVESKEEYKKLPFPRGGYQ